MSDDRVVEEIVTKFLLDTCRVRRQFSKPAAEAAKPAMHCTQMASRPTRPHVETSELKTSMQEQHKSNFWKFQYTSFKKCTKSGTGCMNSTCGMTYAHVLHCSVHWTTQDDKCCFWLFHILYFHHKHIMFQHNTRWQTRFLTVNMSTFQ